MSKNEKQKTLFQYCFLLFVQQIAAARTKISPNFLGDHPSNSTSNPRRWNDGSWLPYSAEMIELMAVLLEKVWYSLMT